MAAKNRVQSRIKWKNIRKAYELIAPRLKASPIKQTLPDCGTVLVLAPHIDDEVIGCGGTLRKHVLQGDKVSVVYIADCSPERQQEAQRAADIIGFEIDGFWPYEGKTWPEHSTELLDRIDRLITRINPDSVYLPSLWDRSHDHLVLNQLLVQLHRLNNYKFTVYGMEIWSPVWANFVVDISATAEQKRQALEAFVSQTPSVDWAVAAMALNNFRGLTQHAGDYAECFTRHSMSEYSKIWQAAYG